MAPSMGTGQYWFSIKMFLYSGTHDWARCDGDARVDHSRILAEGANAAVETKLKKFAFASLAYFFWVLIATVGFWRHENDLGLAYNGRRVCSGHCEQVI